MGTTLTGTTPQDTYESLIKVGDNGPLSGTAKFLSDGEGLDSALALSTTRVGINTSTPNTNLHISGDVNNRAILRLASTAANRMAAVEFFGNNVESAIIGYEGGSEILGGGVQGDLIIRNVLAGKDIIITTNAGNVGIGTSAPAVPLDVVGNIRSSTGILFGSDTAAANALDDYEEGTWTMGVSFGGASVGVTASANTGTYTKIGRQVTVNGFLALTSKGSSTGNAKITGLPFTVPNSAANLASASLRLFSISFANQFMGFGDQNTTTIELNEVTEAGVVTSLADSNFANNSAIIVSLTYFV